MSDTSFYDSLSEASSRLDDVLDEIPPTTSSTELAAALELLESAIRLLEPLQKQ